MNETSIRIFIAYPTHFCYCIHKTGQTFFKLEVGLELKDILKTTSKATVIKHLNVGFYMNLYQTIYDARRSNLLEGLINPSQLPGFTDRVALLNRANRVSFRLSLWLPSIRPYIMTIFYFFFCHRRFTNAIHRSNLVYYMCCTTIQSMR